MNDIGMFDKLVLNEYQRAAVEDESRACLVKANVGSGKTTVLVEKLRYLHERKGIPYARMVVLTFTNKAADEIRERLGAVQSENASLSNFGTFHSVALHFLQEWLPIEALGYRSGFAVIDPDEELELAQALIRKHGLQIKYKNRLKKRLEQEEKAWRQGKEQSRFKDELFLLFPLLEQEKIRLNRFSFSDLIRVAAELLAKEEAERKPDWIVVDEVQDSDRLQLDFVASLMGEHSHLFAVGDPNQVIYSWRGGAENIFFLLSRMFEAKELSLPVNYRSNAAILDAAKSFQQSGDRLRGVRAGGIPVQVRNHYDPFAEALFLAGRISGLLADGVSADEIAVFYRLQNQAELLEKEFLRSNIPVSVSLKRTASDIPVIRWLIRVLRCACDPQDNTSAFAVLTDKNYGPGLTEKKAEALLAGGEKCEAAGLREAAEFFGRIRNLAFQEQFVCAQEIFDYLLLSEALHPSAASYIQDREWTLEFLEHVFEYPGMSFRDRMNTFLTSSSLYGLQIGQSKTIVEEKAVQLMTLHASKGLEFQYVFIIGVNYGLIPLASGSEQDEEEERRLFFVGMTRAKDYLELSWYTNPGTLRVVPGESRYLSMIPPYLLERGEKMETAKADLTAMRRAAAKLRGESREGAVMEREKTTAQPRVRHARYGVGTVLEETDDKIKVQFDTLGEKEFMKAFVVLERLT